MSATLSEPQIKRCTGCLQVKALDQFRRKYAGKEDRHTRCNSCESAAKRLRRQKVRDKRLYKFNQQLNREVRTISAVFATTAELVNIAVCPDILEFCARVFVTVVAPLPATPCPGELKGR